MIDHTLFINFFSLLKINKEKKEKIFNYPLIEGASTDARSSGKL